MHLCTTVPCMNALAYQEDTLTVTTGENWTAYLRRITCGLTRKEIAAAANINVSGVSRWLTGVSQPSTEKVIGFARSLNQNPLEALIAAGYLSPEDVTGPSQSNNRFLNYPTTRSSKSCAGGCGIVYPVVSGLSAPGVCAAPVRSFSRGGLPSDFSPAASARV